MGLAKGRGFSAKRSAEHFRVGSVPSGNRPFPKSAISSWNVIARKFHKKFAFASKLLTASVTCKSEQSLQVVGPRKKLCPTAVGTVAFSSRSSTDSARYRAARASRAGQGSKSTAKGADKLRVPSTSAPCYSTTASGPGLRAPGQALLCNSKPISS